MRLVGEPPRKDSTVTVHTSDGKTATVHYADSHAWARADDPVLGLNGTVAGAELLTHYSQVRTAMRAAERSGDGLFRAVGLGPDGGDGIALAGPGRKIVLFESGDDWAGRLQRALGVDTSETGPLIRYTDGGEPQHVAKNGLKPGKGEVRTLSLVDAYRENPGAVYASPRLTAQLSDGKGELPRSAVPHEPGSGGGGGGRGAAGPVR